LLHGAGTPAAGRTLRGCIEREDIMSDINKDEKVVVARSSFNVANIILAIAVLIAVIGLLKYIGASPF
jgi:hypothetical protein